VKSTAMLAAIRDAVQEAHAESEHSEQCDANGDAGEHHRAGAS
jgi:hypothetical protein